MFRQLLLHARARGIISFVGQIYFDQLIHRPKIVWSKRRTFLERLARFVSFLVRAQGHTQIKICFGRLRRAFELIAQNRSGLVGAPQSFISTGQENARLRNIGMFFEQVLHRRGHRLWLTRAKI